MAGQVASVAVDKLTEKLGKGGDAMPCIGPHCCQQSTCMNVMGMHCSLERGPTKCIGSSTFPPKKGMCACLQGACSIDGKCSSAGLPGGSPAPAVPQQPLAQQQAAQLAGPAAQQTAAAPQQPAAAAAAPAAAVGDNGKFSQWHGQGDAPAGADQFNTWHTASRLYASGGEVGGGGGGQSLGFVSLALAAAAAGLLAGAAVVGVRAGRRAWRQRFLASGSEEEGLVVDSSGDEEEA